MELPISFNSQYFILIKRTVCLDAERHRALPSLWRPMPPSTTSLDDVIKWKHFPSYWPPMRGIHRSPVNSPHNGQWRGALSFLSSGPEQLLSKQSRRWWFETPSSLLWRHCNEYLFTMPVIMNLVVCNAVPEIRAIGCLKAVRTILLHSNLLKSHLNAAKILMSILTLLSRLISAQRYLRLCVESAASRHRPRCARNRLALITGRLFKPAAMETIQSYYAIW